MVDLMNHTKKPGNPAPSLHLVQDPASGEWCVKVGSLVLSDLAALFMKIGELPKPTRSLVRGMGEEARRLNSSAR